MVLVKIIFGMIMVVVVVAATPAEPSFWKGTILDSTIEEMRSMCDQDDALACIKFKAMSFLDNIFKKDNYQLVEGVEITKNSYRSNEIDGRSEASLEDHVEKYIETHDATFSLPVGDAKVTLNARNLESDEIDLKLKFGNKVEARKSKLKKIFVPILVFVLLKAITLIPLAIGILGLKAWNALQLSFFSFVVSVSLAVFQLCKKIAADNAHPQIAAHTPWDAPHYAARSLDEEAQKMAYAAYRK